ncbi:YeeE/YedE family protein [Oryzomicrobium sp.]|uniref:YeeE/YedE family protein n=1 Tax=Oryzomicrobium sp. TaxID=1911578 RepID=UPI002FE17A48
MDVSQLASQVVLYGFFLGALLGFSTRATHFCTVGAVADVVSMGSFTRLRMWSLAIAVAILGAALLEVAFDLPLARTIYRQPRLPLVPFVTGGLLFGAGMVLASGCGLRSLTRAGGGNLKSLVAFLVLALTAEMTMHGILTPLRTLVQSAPPLPLPAPDVGTLAAGLGLAPGTARIVAAIVVGGLFLAWALASRDVWRTRPLLGGLAVGCLVVGAWYVTGHLGFVAEDPDTLEEAFIGTASGRPEALTFVGPLAHSLEWLSWANDGSRKVTFGIATVAGAFLGALLQALAFREFRWEGFRDARDTARHLIGAVLMGFGGILAMGCTLGQGVTGVSTLALASFVALAAIIAGAFAMVRLDLWWMERQAG